MIPATRVRSDSFQYAGLGFSGQSGVDATGLLSRAVAALERIADATSPPSGEVMQQLRTSCDPASLPIAPQDLNDALSDLRKELREIKEAITAEKGEITKEAYTVEEVAKKTKLAPFTIRQACNKKRINGAYKGRDHAWRIPNASLLDILANGLPPE